MKELILQLNTSKATGPNGIPTKIQQLLKNEMCKPLSIIYNLSVMSGSHPQRLKFVNTISQYIKKVLVYSFQTTDQYHYFQI